MCQRTLFRQGPRRVVATIVTILAVIAFPVVNQARGPEQKTKRSKLDRVLQKA